MSRKVSGQELSAGRNDFEKGKKAIVEEFIVKERRVPSSDNLLSVAAMLKARIAYEQGLLRKINEVSQNFEVKKGSFVDTSRIYTPEIVKKNFDVSDSGFTI